MLIRNIRNKLRESSSLGVLVAVALLLVAGLAIAVQNWPEKRADLGQAYYTTDDGATWFKDSVYKIAPFEHEGREAVIAQIYSYDNGRKQFCAYTAKYTPEAKQRLEEAIAAAEARGEPPHSVALFRDRGFMARAMLVKAPGPDKPWVPMHSLEALEVVSVRSPDGSAIDQVFVY